jgi:hypothetical protein
MARMNRISAILVTAVGSSASCCGGASVTVPKPPPSVGVSKKATGSVELDPLVTVRSAAQRDAELRRLWSSRRKAWTHHGPQQRRKLLQARLGRGPELRPLDLQRLDLRGLDPGSEHLGRALEGQ